MNQLTLQLNDGHRGVLVSVELDERKTTVGLHANFGEVADGLEEGDEVRLGAVRDKIADVNGGVEGRGLLDHGLVREGTALEVDRRRSTASTSASWASRGATADWQAALGLLVGPVDADGAGSEPFAVHGGDGLLGIGLVPKGKETVTARLARVHVPHDAGVGHGTEGGEGLGEDVVVDLGGKVADEDVEVVGSVFLVLLALVSPVHADLGVEDFAAIEGLESGLGGTHVHVLDEAVVEAAMLVVAVGDDLDVLDGPGDGEDLGEHVLGHSGAEVANVEVSPSLFDDLKGGEYTGSGAMVRCKKSREKATKYAQGPPLHQTCPLDSWLKI